MKASIGDVALKAGVSNATVSRTFAHPEQVSEATRIKVQAAADALNFSISRSARILKSGRTYRVALLIGSHAIEWFTAEIIAGLNDVLRDAGYDLVIYPIEGAEARDAFFEELPVRNNADAVFVSSFGISPDEVKHLGTAKIPIVGVNTTGKAFVGLENYIRGIERTNLISSFGWTVVVTVGAVLLIIVCTSMCAWWIVRTNNWAARLLYTLFLFNMIVPFQMVMFTLSKLADMMGLNTPWGLWIVYLGFGAGLAVFIFTGVVKGIPSELEESAMIDGASVPRIFFQIVLPIMRPSLISVAILQTMWIWNDFLLPYLTLDMRRFKTMSIAIQYLKGGYGSVDMGAMMACLVVAIVPIIIFYLCCQKYIIKGVMAGAVKG